MIEKTFTMLFSCGSLIVAIENYKHLLKNEIQLNKFTTTLDHIQKQNDSILQKFDITKTK
jgi:hypothetical protein